MSKKIVVITGSPRKNGNSFAMTDAFIKAAEAKGHTVTRFDAAMMKIGGCRACETCFKSGKACSFDDDFNTIAPAILDADLVVFTMPVYWYSIPAQIKGVIDRLYSFCVAGKDIAEKECARKGHCGEGMRSDRLLRRGGYECAGRSEDSDRAFRCFDKMAYGRRSSHPRRIEHRRY